MTSVFSLMSKPDNDIIRKEKYRAKTLMNIYAEILNNILANQIQQYIKMKVYHNQGSHSRNAI